MNIEDFKKQWKKFLIDIGISETELAEKLGTNQSNLNQKTRNGTIKYVELSEIVEKFGYNINIKKEEK